MALDPLHLVFGAELGGVQRGFVHRAEHEAVDGAAGRQIEAQAEQLDARAAAVGADLAGADVAGGDGVDDEMGDAAVGGGIEVSARAPDRG